jgi:hypothetical protein
MVRLEPIALAPNWTSAAGALEGILSYLGAPLPRHAIMGLTGHAWHTCLASREGVVALPSGPADLDREQLAQAYSATGFRWERFGTQLRPEDDWQDAREAAAAWAHGHLEAGRPLLGWDFHLHEHAIVFGDEPERRGFLVEDLLSAEYGPFVALEDWPSALGIMELVAPVEPLDLDPFAVVAAALDRALACFDGLDGPADGQPRGTAALDAWAEALDGDTEVDRAGNAYTLAVLQPARSDGALFLDDLAASLPAAAEPLAAAARALRDEAQALAPLITLFPFPSGGHGNVANPGLRRAAAMALRRAASHERSARAAIASARALFDD